MNVFEWKIRMKNWSKTTIFKILGQKKLLQKFSKNPFLVRLIPLARGVLLASRKEIVGDKGFENHHHLYLNNLNKLKTQTCEEFKNDIFNWYLWMLLLDLPGCPINSPLSVRPFVLLSPAFSSDWLVSFFLIFGTKMQNGNYRNVMVPDFWKKFFRPKMPEICRKNRFFGIF